MFLRFALVLLLVLQSVSGFAADIQTQVFPLERNGVALHLERMQTGDQSTGKPLLLVHGLTYSSHEFDVDHADYSVARFLANNGYSVWRLDIAGYGESAEVQDGFMPNSDYAAEDIAAASKKILEVSGQKKLDVLGWSWGTVTSSRFAAKYPEMVGKLVLYAPILVGLGKHEVTKPFNHNTWPHAAGDFQVNPDKSINSNIVEPAVAATFLSNCWRYDEESSPNGGRRDLLVEATTRLIPLDKIKSPTLVITGDTDDYVNVSLCREAESILPKGSQVVVIKGGGHAMMMEKPHYVLFRKNVLEFLTASGASAEAKAQAK